MLDFVMPVRSTIAVDVVAWAAFHAGTGYAAHRLADHWLDREGWLLRARSFEDAGRWYRRRLRIHTWKDRVPEAGDLFAGGINKSRLPAHSDGGLERFIRETRRAELAHWSALACGPLFAVWNPPLPTTLLITYGLLANLPFIAIQRYNRCRCQSILALRSRRSLQPELLPMAR
jgi:glycosyl-4,4'-diaponeurosporenoate acyltransferase